MATKISLKKSSVEGKVPLATDLEIGELAVNLADGKLYSKNASNAVITVGGQEFIGGTGISITGDTITNTAPHIITNLGYNTGTRLLSSSTGSNVTLPQVTTTVDGLMIAGDKSKLNGIANNATANTGTVTSVTGGDGLSGTVTTTGSLAVDGTVIRTTTDQTKTGSFKVERSTGTVFSVGSTSSPIINFDTGGTSTSTPYRIYSWGSDKTLSLESMGDVNIVLDHNNNQAGKSFRVRHNGEGDAGAALFTVNDSGNLSWTGTASGNGSGLTTLNATNLSSGTVATARLPAAALIGDTTYSAGDGLTLSGTVFSLPVATSGSGTFVTSITRTATGITANLGTPPNTNTTYANITAAEITAGTAGTLRTLSGSTAKLIADRNVGTANPVMDGAVRVGTSLLYARQDHRHPVDTSRAAASHTHTLSQITDSGNLAAINTNASTANYLRGDGTWVTPPNTNTTYANITAAEITAGTATTLRTLSGSTAKLIADRNVGTANPLVDGTVSVGTSLLYARQDHRHPITPTNLSWTAGTTAGPRVNSSTGNNSVMPSASATASGAVTTGTQSFAGLKTFTTALAVTGTGKAAGRFYAGTTDPTNTTRTNYDGNLHAKGFGTGRFMMEYNDATESLDFNFA